MSTEIPSRLFLSYYNPAPTNSTLLSQLNHSVSHSAQANISYTTAYKRGLTAFNNCNWKSAICAFSTSLFFAPENSNALYNRAICHLKQNEWKSAVNDLEAIIRNIDLRQVGSRAPSLSEFELRVVKGAATIHLWLDQMPEAISRTLKGLEQDLQSNDFLTLSAKIYLRYNNLAKAEEEINKISEDHPERRDLINTLNKKKCQGPYSNLDCESTTPEPCESADPESRILSAPPEVPACHTQ